MKRKKLTRQFLVDFRHNICIIKQRENKGFHVPKPGDVRVAIEKEARRIE